MSISTDPTVIASLPGVQNALQDARQRPVPFLAVAEEADGPAGWYIHVLAVDGPTLAHALAFPQWTDWRPASAGHRLIEKGYMVHPPAHVETDRAAGWQHLPGGRWAAPVHTRDELAGPASPGQAGADDRGEVGTGRTSPRAAAFALVGAVASHAATHHNRGQGGQPPADWEMYRALTAALEAWHAEGTLREDALTMTEWVTTELCGYVLGRFDGNQDQFEQWLLEHGDRVARSQTHKHPAGPTAVEIMSVVSRAGRLDTAEKVALIALPFLLYLREGHEVEDAREVALTLGMWAGEYLATTLEYDVDRITAYTAARAAG
ncbi:hypothetical protein [Streptomyces sasae]|uniref:hypothetical protein n=1 Tax=Streptomyces sasae TaxID=1266772 RepID=UPI00292E2676|nr:hypothetical protein [Streptomyces sasae]